MIEHIGDYVKIGDRMIPAVNIQVENVPGYIDMGRGRTHWWFGVYFEIGFEDGSLWVVNYGDNKSLYLNGDSVINTFEYATFAYDPAAEHTAMYNAKDWNEFLAMFLKKVESISV
jgi:hypothetical protein